MSNGRQLFVIAVILATFGALAVAGGPALEPGAGPDQVGDMAGSDSPGTDESSSAEGTDPDDEPDEGTGSDTSDQQETRPAVVEECAADPPADFADPAGGNSETVGWVDGYWYNEPLDIDVDSGINQTELDRLSARTAARFEAMRCLTADEGVPPVEIQTREEFRDEQSALFEQRSLDLRLFDNAKLETLLLVDSETDATDERESNRGATVGGTYDFINNEIVIVTDDPENLLIDEQVLAHELGHAIQDQAFDLSQYDRPTVDEDKGKLALIEGDVHLIEQRYLDACTNGEWEQECVSVKSDSQQGDVSIPNWGLYFTNFQPYSDGPAFVQHFYETGDGWESVNELYENPPTSAIQTVQPERFPELQPVNVSVPDRSTDDWERIGQQYDISYDTIGIAGIAGMFMTPSVESNGIDSILERSEYVTGEERSPLEYLHPETDGWRGDRFYAYHGSGNETGSVWKLQWETAADSEQFVDGYREMIEYRGGQPVDSAELTYEFGSESEYDMAVRIAMSGDQVTIVTAPSLEELDEIHDVELAVAN